MCHISCQEEKTACGARCTVADVDLACPVATASGDDMYSIGACNTQRLLDENESTAPASADESQGSSGAEQTSPESVCTSGGNSDGSRFRKRFQRIRSRMSMCFEEFFKEEPPCEVTIRAGPHVFSLTMPGGSTVGCLQHSAVQKYVRHGCGRVGSARLQTQQGAVLNRFKMLSEVNTDEGLVLIVHECRGGVYGSACACSVSSVCSLCSTSSLCNSCLDIPVAVQCGQSDSVGSTLTPCSLLGSTFTNGSSRQSLVRFDEVVELLD